MPQEDDTALEEPDTEIDHSGKPKPTEFAAELEPRGGIRTNAIVIHKKIRKTQNARSCCAAYLLCKRREVQHLDGG